MLPHIKGKWAGRPVVLDLWQIFIVTTVFGWYRKNGGCRFRTGTSRWRERTPKALFPQVALYMLTADSEPGGNLQRCDDARPGAHRV